MPVIARGGRHILETEGELFRFPGIQRGGGYKTCYEMNARDEPGVMGTAMSLLGRRSGVFRGACPRVEDPSYETADWITGGEDAVDMICGNHIPRMR